MSETTFLPINFSEIDITDLTDIDTAFAEICEPVDLLALGKVRWQRARQSAKAGIPIAPLRPNTKEPFGNCEDCKDERCGYSGADKANCPCVENGNPQGNKCHAGYAATCDLVVVDYWFEESNYQINYLEHNTPLFVLDFDVVWVDGIATMPGKEAFEEANPGVLESATQKVVTPSGGEHYKWLRTYSGEMYRGSKAFGKQLFGDGKDDPSRHTDTKTGLGSYNVGPLSRTDDGTYEEVRSGELTELQADVFDRFKKNGSAAVSAPLTGQAGTSPTLYREVPQISMGDLTETMRKEVIADLLELESDLAKVDEDWHMSSLGIVADTGKYVGSGLYDFEQAVERLVPIAMTSGADDKPRDSEAVVERKVRNWLAKGAAEGLSEVKTRYYQMGVDSGAPSSWDPVDLSALRANGYSRPVPTFFTCCNKAEVSLLYPGKSHTVYGKSGDGKTLAMLGGAAQELLKGHSVLFLDFEDDADIVVLDRLHDTFGVPWEILDDRSKFRYVNPEGKPAPGSPDAAKFAELSGHGWDIVIVDAMTEAAAAWGIVFEGGSDGGAGKISQFTQEFVLPFLKAGSSVTLIDHVKLGDSNGFATGSSHKRNAIRGAAYEVTATKSFGLGARGSLDFYVRKDRPGSLRKFEDNKKRVATFWLDSTNADHITYGFDSVQGAVSVDFSTVEISDEAKAEMVHQFLVINPGASKRKVLAVLTGDQNKRDSTLTTLISIGRIKMVRETDKNGKTKSERHWWVDDDETVIGLD
ncbi:bifunctional DNA primase/polymerase [Streptomyces sp. NPDC102441]|uniref:bifunctional DNA primase/polymerase n=1 Tax=Streptomyces sp. NPDC102441 TaxID=3366176 RepID=UPI0037F58C73